VTGRLIVVSGLPGVGKSEAARRVAAALGAAYLSIDPVEEALLSAGLAPGWTTGVAAYEAVRAAAASNLSVGLTVVVEAVNDSEPARETWRRAVASTDASLHWVMITCSDVDEHRRRLEDRERGLRFINEPTWDDVRDRAEKYPPWTHPVLHVDSAGRSAGDVAGEIRDSLS
jgi:predicted kinase